MVLVVVVVFWGCRAVVGLLMVGEVLMTVEAIAFWLMIGGVVLVVVVLMAL